MKIGNDALEQASNDFQLVAAHATVAPNSEWTVLGANFTATDIANRGSKRSIPGVFGGGDTPLKIKTLAPSKP